METRIAIFRNKEIRRTIHKNEWWFVVNDIVQALTNTSDPSDYIKKMRLRDEELSQGWGQIVTPLFVPTTGGRQQLNCANTEGIFRIVQSIPSPKAEPFKRWLAKVGYERVQEIEDPELGAKRTRVLYKLKGCPDSWIDLRMRGIDVRENLTNEWQKRGAKEQKDYEILTAEIAKATFDLTPSQHKKLKGLKRENLRDHMGNLELIFNMLGEASTTEIHKSDNSQGLPKLKSDAKTGGSIAGGARKNLEKRLGRPIVSKENFLNLSKKQIEFAPTTQIDQYADIAADFFKRILKMNYKNVFVSDESILRDFQRSGTEEKLLKKIKDVYSIDVSGVKDGNLVKIFKRIKANQVIDNLSMTNVRQK